METDIGGPVFIQIDFNSHAIAYILWTNLIGTNPSWATLAIIAITFRLNYIVRMIKKSLCLIHMNKADLGYKPEIPISPSRYDRKYENQSIITWQHLTSGSKLQSNYILYVTAETFFWFCHLKDDHHYSDGL